jgi:hypothetical protein
MTHPGHKDSFKNLECRINEIVDHHKQRKDEIMAAIKGKLLNANKIGSQVKWKSIIGH